MENNKLQQILPTQELMSISKLFAESGMFTDTKQASQAFVKIMAGQEIGIPPFAAMSGVHIIQGKPAIGAGLMASTVKGSGKYDYRVIQQTDAVCSIDFYQGQSKIGNSTFTIQDAKKAGTKNLDKFPKNMLFARAMSNGVKWFCPDVFSGPVYTPEEFASDTVDIPYTDATPEEFASDTVDIPYTDATPEEFASDTASDPVPDKAIIDSIEACTTSEDIKKIYDAIPKNMKKLYKEVCTRTNERIEAESKSKEA